MAFELVIYQTLLDQKIPAPLAKLITAQSQFESGNYKSRVFLTDNNAFGYKFVGQKIATKGLPSPKNEGDNYAHYDSVKDSAIEIANWVKRRVKEKRFPALNTITTAEQYSKLLKDTNYHTSAESNYTKGLKYYLDKLKIGSTLPVIGLFILAAFFFLRRK